MLVHELLERAAASGGQDETALVAGPVSKTYGELWEAARNLAADLRASGLTVGGRVVIFLPNSADAVVAIFGVAAAGGCFVIAEPSTPAARLRVLIEHSGATAVIAPETRVALLDEATAGMAQPPRRLLAGRSTSPFAIACATPAGEGDLPAVEPTGPVALIYTSGSTGEPKGVTLSHRNVDAVSEAVSSYLGHRRDDVVLSVLQLAFGYGLLQLLVTFRTGGRLVLMQGFGFPYDIVNTMATERVTGFAGVPTLFSMLLQLDGVDDLDLSSVRYVTNAAAALPPSFVPRLRTRFPNAELFLMHGQTECLRTSFLPPSEVDRIPTSIGRGMPNVELWLEDDHGNRPAVGELGEMIVRGPGVMLGYWNDPEGTQRVVRDRGTGEDRELRTGDLFRADADGFLYFVARRDDIIKSRGRKVSPLEIEQLLYAHAGVLEARVVGVPDEILGQAIRAEIVLADGAEHDQHLDEQGVKRYLRTQLEDYKIPQIVAFVDSLPKSSSGKIRRT